MTSIDHPHPEPALSVVVPTFNNVAVLTECLDCWRRFAADAPVELIVIEDGCRDGTADYLAGLAGTTWGRAHLRTIHENNVHELRATNRGMRAARAKLAMAWQDDMFLRASWLVPELVATFARRPDLGLLCLSRGLNFTYVDDPIASWQELVGERRVQSTIGPRLFNWLRLQEVDGVIRPWIVRRACLERVGDLDEAFAPTGWDESDLAFRIRRAGWLVATHGYERDGAYFHLGSSTLTRFNLDLDRDLQNGLLFHERWDEIIRREQARARRSWWRSATLAGWIGTGRQLANFMVPSRRRSIIAGALRHVRS
jgi:glycosyltransferase involved in cell wall biosynthesis